MSLINYFSWLGSVATCIHCHRKKRTSASRGKKQAYMKTETCKLSSRVF